MSAACVSVAQLQGVRRCAGRGDPWLGAHGVRVPARPAGAVLLCVHTRGLFWPVQGGERVGCRAGSCREEMVALAGGQAAGGCRGGAEGRGTVYSFLARQWLGWGYRLGGQLEEGVLVLIAAPLFLWPPTPLPHPAVWPVGG